MASPQSSSSGRCTIDCSKYPGSTCSLSISGTEDEVLDEAVRHGIGAHGHKDEPGFRDELRKMISREGRA